MFMLILLLSSYGLCFLLQNKLLFLENRFELLDKLLQCTFCCGFHCGWIIGLSCLSINPYVESYTIADNACFVVVFAFASASFCYGLDALIKVLEKYGEE